MSFAYQTVKFVAVTLPTSVLHDGHRLSETLDKPTAEDLIAYCARVSNPANQKNFDTASKLLRYCISNKHWSPFEMVNVVMEIVTTRDMSHQIIRHPSFRFQEFSQRYAKVDSETFVVREARSQDPKNRQNSVDDLDPQVKADWEDVQQGLASNIASIYEWAIDHGIAKECARVILPEGMTPTRLYMSGTLRSWMHYYQLRHANGTQLEHRDIADKAWPLLKEEFHFLDTAEQLWIEESIALEEARALRASMQNIHYAFEDIKCRDDVSDAMQVVRDELERSHKFMWAKG